VIFNTPCNTYPTLLKTSSPHVYDEKLTRCLMGTQVHFIIFLLYASKFVLHHHICQLIVVGSKSLMFCDVLIICLGFRVTKRFSWHSYIHKSMCKLCFYCFDFVVQDPKLMWVLQLANGELIFKFIIIHNMQVNRKTWIYEWHLQLVYCCKWHLHLKFK